MNETSIPHRVIRPSVLYFGTPVALLSTVNTDGSANLTPISSAWALGQRVVLGIGLEGQALRNLERDGDCVVNLPDATLWPRVERIARTTGRADVPAAKAALGYEHAADKFALGRLAAAPGDLVRAARAVDCPLQLEGRALPIDRAAAVARGFAIVEVDVLRVHAHERITVPDSDHVDTARWQPLLYVFRHYCGTAAPSGANFRAETTIATP